MVSKIKSSLSYGEMFSRVTTGDIVFTFTTTFFNTKKVKNFGIIIKKNGTNMVLLNTKTGFRLRPLKWVDSFIWFPTRATATPLADKIILLLLRDSGISWQNTLNFWFRKQESNLRLLEVAKALFVNLFINFPVKMPPTAKNLEAWAENNSGLFHIITADTIFDTYIK